MYKALLESGNGVSQFGKIRCPRHYMLKPGCQPYKIIPNPHTKNISDANIKYVNKTFNAGLRKYIYAKDKNGNKIQDFNNFYQPLITKGFAIEHIYDPVHPICAFQCKGRCLDGIGKPNIKAIKRLSGNG